MKLFTCTRFTGYYPVGSAAVILANDVTHACHLLEDKLASIGLPQTITEDMIERAPQSKAQAVILVDGNY